MDPTDATRDFDDRLAERALREAWPVPEDRRPSWPGQV